MLKLSNYVFSAITLILVAYGLITKNFEFNSLMLFFLGLTMLVRGLQEFQQKRNVYGWMFVGVFLISLFVSVQGFLLR
ncbi:DUF3953 domain-containing protein [Lysinibacillus sp. NPDC097287]|uniref:DUF3953 domain-containing protein n=1 Tax=Lysinibacillus sp. NPDC097287 TaxID=3364144 RepID=UPI00380E804B